MFLTRNEFDRIRPLQWSLKNYGNEIYHTILDKTEIQLFWLDFMRLIFAPKYKNQNGVVNIENFDLTQPVLMSDEMELILPTDVNMAMYYANNTTLPMNFSINISQLTVMIASLVLFAILISLYFIYSRHLMKKHNQQQFHYNRQIQHQLPQQSKKSTTATSKSLRPKLQIL